METRKPNVWDYGWDKTGWGHDYMIHGGEAGKSLLISGFGQRYKMREGDFMLLKAATEGKSIAVRITEIEWKSDPRDMFKATVEFDYEGYMKEFVNVC